MKNNFQKLYLDDNLNLMKTIESNTIDLIYCDILYGTGRKFKDYQDLKPNRIEIENHYIPRLKEMHRILKPTGSIYLQMDSNINYYIRSIMNDVFNDKNFRNEIVWIRSNGMNQEYRHFPKIIDTLLFYTKTKNYTFNPVYEECTESTDKRYNKVDEKGNRYMLMSLQHSKNFSKENDIRLFNGKKYCNTKGLGWDWSQDTLERKINEGYIIEENTKGSLAYRIYFSGLKKATCVWEFKQKKIDKKYETQKPKELLMRIINASSKENDLVADFYLGSGTTAIVCKELNRNFIGCDINPKSIKVTNERLLDILF